MTGRYSQFAHHDEPARQGRYLTSFQRKLLLETLLETLSPQQRQRIEIMLLADEGKTQAQICKILGCSPATARHWLFLARSGMAHYWLITPIGRPRTITEPYLERLRELASKSPKECGFSFERWSAGWLSRRLAKEFDIKLSERHINRLLKQMGLSTRSHREQTSQRANQSRIVIRNLPMDETMQAQEWSYRLFMN